MNMVQAQNWKKCPLSFSSKIEVPGSASSQLGLARAGKFQLEPITIY